LRTAVNCVSGDGSICQTDGGSSTHPAMFGWTAGGGLEWRYQQFIFRGEYRYSDYGNTDVSYFQPDISLGEGIHTRLHTTTQMAYFGVSYLWGPRQGGAGREEQ